MRKLILFILLILFLPFIIVYCSPSEDTIELKLNYGSDRVIRVKRVNGGSIDSIGLEE